MMFRLGLRYTALWSSASMILLAPGAAADALECVKLRFVSSPLAADAGAPWLPPSSNYPRLNGYLKALSRIAAERREKNHYETFDLAFIKIEPLSAAAPLD